MIECEGTLVAVGRYDRLPESTEAEVAFVVADSFQHHGLGTLLLDELAAAAWVRSITVFVASTLAENRSMLDVFHHSGFVVTSRNDHETILLRFNLSERSRVSARRATDVGASRAPIRTPLIIAGPTGARVTT